MALKQLRIGTRASQLALWQANWVKAELEKKYPGMEVTLTKIKTMGDKILDVALAHGHEAHVIEVAFQEPWRRMTEHDPGPHDLERVAELY